MISAQALDALAARLSDPAPAFECEGQRGVAGMLVRVQHLGGPPTSPEDLAWLGERLGDAGSDLLALYERWNGLTLGLERGLDLPSYLVALHAVGDPMLDETAGALDRLDGLERTEIDALGWTDALAIGSLGADPLLVLTRGPRAGQIGWLDHETLHVEPFAPSAQALVERLAGDPVVLARDLHAWSYERLLPVAYVRDARGR